MSDLSKLEVQALDKIVDELDYYQLLHLEADASSSEIKKAYHQTSRTFHPDANRHLEPDMRARCARISKRVTEAYCVLRDPRRRAAYDEKLGQGGGIRMQLAEAKAAHSKQQTAERQGRTPQGRQFFSRACADAARGDHAAAEQNLKMALTFESDNAGFREMLEEVRKSK